MTDNTWKINIMLAILTIQQHGAISGRETVEMLFVFSFIAKAMPLKKMMFYNAKS